MQRQEQQPPKPRKRIEAKVYVGRAVRKAFGAKGKGKKTFFLGQVVDVPVFDGDVCYSIDYEDGDKEDIAWEELVKIMLPEEPAATPGGGLRDATNRPKPRPADGGQEADGGAAAKRGRQAGVSSAAPDAAAGPSASERPAKQAKRGEAQAQRQAQDGAGPCATQGLTPLRTQQAAEPQAEAQPQERPGKRVNEGPPPRKRRASAGTKEDAAEAGPMAAVDDREQEEQEAAAADEGGAEEPADGRDGEPQPEAVALAAPIDERITFVPRTKGLAGHILRVHCENLMCHAHFELEFGPHITVISGSNGSGKSAVVQALQVCLGASARETSRGKSLSEFVRYGCNEAKVQVTLWNTGPEAFRPEVYGERITVERVIKSSGATTISLLDARGHKVKGAGRNELLSMCEHLCLDPANPLTIITQDTARDLGSGSGTSGANAVGRKLYDLFEQATLQDIVKDNMNQSAAKLTVAKAALEACGATLQKDLQEQAQLSKKLQQLKSIESLLEQRDVLERAILWRAVQQVDRLVADAEAAAASQGPQRVAVCDRHMAALNWAKADMQERLRELDALLQTHDELFASFTARAKAMHKDAHEAGREVERATRALQTARNALLAVETEKMALDEKFSQTQTQAPNDQLHEARRLMEDYQQRLTAKQEEVTRVSMDAKAAGETREGARQEVTDLGRQLQAANATVESKRNAVAALQHQLRQLAGAQNDRLSLFGANTLNQLIQRNGGQFRALPIGPVGALLSVADDRWTLAVEVACASVMSSYLVSCPQDASLLRSMMESVRYHGSVVITNFAAYVYDIPYGRRPANGFPSIMDQLVVDAAVRPPVINYLIDKLHIERLALVETAAQGRDVTYRDAAGAHILFCYDRDGNRHNGGSIKFTDRNHKFTRGRCRLTGDMRQYMASLQAEVDKEEALMGAAQEDVRALTARREQAEARVRQCDLKYRSLVTLKARTATDFNRMKEQVPVMPNTEQEDEDAKVMMTQMMETEGDIIAKRLAVTEQEAALQRCQGLYDQAVAQVTAEAERVQERMAEGDKLRVQKNDVARRMEEVQGFLITAVSKRDNAVSKQAQLQKAVKAARARQQEVTEAASEVCSRHEGDQALVAARRLLTETVATSVRLKLQRRAREMVGKSAEELQELQATAVEANMDCEGLSKELGRIAKLINNAEKEAGEDAQALALRLEAVTQRVALMQGDYRKVEALIRRTQASYDVRVSRFNAHRNQLEAMACIKFAKYMGRSAHVGKLVFNHAAQRVDFNVVARGKVNDGLKGTSCLSNLSGGEKTYTLDSFLLAAGAITESPFRVLDEFDVFLDKAHVRVVTDSILEVALDMDNRQYILLTPQAIDVFYDARQDLARKLRMELPPAFMKVIALRPARP